MKQALILSYHFPPMDVIASRRTEALAQNLSANDIFPTILTHRWEMTNTKKDEKGELISWSWKWFNNDDDVLVEKNEKFNVIRVPRFKRIVNKNSPKLYNKINTFASLILGELDTSEHYTYHNFKSFLWKHLLTEKYDVVLAIFSPHNHVRLAYDIKKKFGIPYIVDYRDLWDNRLANPEFKPLFSEKLKYLIYKWWHKKWLSQSLFFISVSKPLVEKIKELTSFEKGFIISNGFEKSLFSGLQKVKQDKFVIFHGGNFYAEQNLDYIIKALNILSRLLKSDERKLIKIQLLMMSNEAIKNKFIREVDCFDFEFTKRLPRSAAVQLMNKAEILFFPAFQKSKGIYSGKIFEYVGSGKNILVIPSDHGVVEELILDTQSGLVTDNPEVAANFINSKFQEWLANGSSSYNADLMKVQFYTRENQVRQLANLINENLG